ncbi:G-protein coupled receptor, putative [Pediculus humanus corporis]|uniref:G-protein coupled receptor, putative n=1 Tax=Pediculus humanus subsp. corporis TaxID=121224 RepID=E0VBP7_PEDHC|nr:G-protein coupled receptor, putative [Pediculus humanus corporis]EEB10803.1 G-protein coupled receptor, putative [Pediculus humanus corporis]
MATTRNLTSRNLVLNTMDGMKNSTTTQSDVFFNISLKLAYDVLMKSRQSTDFLFPEIEITLIFIYIVLMTSGVVSNVLVCFVVMKQCGRKKMDFQKSRNLYIVNLAVADLTLCCVCTPFTLITLVQRKWIFGNLLCKIISIVQDTNITVSAGTITAIALDRYFTIVKSRSSNNLNNRKCTSVILIIVLIWIFSFALSFPLYFYTATESFPRNPLNKLIFYDKCVEKWPSKIFHTAFTITLALVQFVIPVTVLTIIHLKISSYLKVHIKPLRKLKPEIHIQSPVEPVIQDKNSMGDDGVMDKSKEDDVNSSKKELLLIKRRESVGSENSNRSCESSLKLSDCSRKNSDSSRNSCDLSPRKKSDFFLSFRENSDFYGFSFSRFSYKSKSTKSNKRREIRRNRRTTFILSCIALVYAVSWLPMTTFQLASAILPLTNNKNGNSSSNNNNNNNSSSIATYLFFAFCHIVAMSSAITNPLLYGWLNTNFRREFSSIFSRISNCYSKLIKTEYDSNEKSKAQNEDNNKSKFDRNTSFLVPPTDSFCREQHQSPEHKMTSNYSNGKLNSSLLRLSPPVNNPRIFRV